ncbi:hypothetical protein [Nocardia rhizosphaerae]|uniref:AhpC/TSA family protein n=1 Tax=Nocardia rhizosphaerae TaxID=1691571 RepID=A0ABV8L7P3_9NOCA
MTRLKVGDQVAPEVLTAIDGRTVALGDSPRPVHLQFRRFAGCPICHLHLRSVVQRHDEILSPAAESD